MSKTIGVPTQPEGVRLDVKYTEGWRTIEFQENIVDVRIDEGILYLHIGGDEPAVFFYAPGFWGSLAVSL